MYCLQWLIPVLFIPKHVLHPTYLVDQAFLLSAWLCAFFLDRRPCYVCSFLFIVAVLVMCFNDSDSFPFWPSCDTVFNGETCRYVVEESGHSLL
uniref:Bladder cancer-associated protein n=1 Tax=Steinernema glaseri TaxID=37863 RepID=A0A1I7ZJU9_9BILA